MTIPPFQVNSPRSYTGERRMRFSWLASAILFVICGHEIGAAQVSTTGSISRLDAALDTVVSTSARLEPLKVDYFGIPEGPVWVRDGANGYLLFSDIGGNLIYKWAPDRTLTKYMERSGFTGDFSNMGRGVFNNGRLIVVTIGSNGLALDREGRLVLCAQGDRAIVRIEKDGTRTILADQYDGARLNNGPNDLAIKSDGAVYFTAGSVYMLKNGTVALLDKDIRANGIAFSQDEKVLYVTNGTKIMRYDVQADGTLANRREFIDTNPSLANVGLWVPDGLKVDRNGNLYTPGPEGIWIVSPEGKHLGTILLPEPATNLAFGNGDGTMLYITTRTGLFRIQLKTAGAGWQ